MMSIKRLSAALGAELHGVNLAEPWHSALIDGILQTFYEHQVLVIPQQTLSPNRFVEFSRIFGRPQPHILSHLRFPEHPEILYLSNVFKNGKPTGVYDGAAYWHTDMSYEAEPGSATMVYSLQAPAVGGETRFTNMYRAYETLPEATQRCIDNLTVLHHYGNRQDLNENSRTSASPLTAEQQQQVKNVFHPLVLRHPNTGRKALYAVSGSSFGIVGMVDAEARTLLDELKEHATGTEFVYSHRYRVGDVVIWDNLSTMHSATLIGPATGPEDTRLLYRISVKREPGIATP